MTRPHRPLPLALLALALALGCAVASPRPARAAPGIGADTACFPGTIATTFGYTTDHNCSAETTSPDGTVSVTFHAFVAAPSVAPDQPVHLVGFPCLTSRGRATDSAVIIAPDGSVTGICHRHP